MSTVRIQIRRGLAADWTSANPVLAAGEIGLESDTNTFKFGDGESTWTELNYAIQSSDQLNDTLADYVPISDLAQPNGVATLNSSGKVPSTQLDIDELSQDAVNTAVTAGSGISKTYNDGANTIRIDNTGVLSVSGTTDQISATTSDGAVTLAFPSSITTPGDVNVGGDLVVTGDLTINGTSTALNTETLLVEDNEILLNANVSGTPSLNAFLKVNRGTSPHAALVWDESTDNWKMTSDSSTFNAIASTGYVDGEITTVSGDISAVAGDLSDFITEAASTYIAQTEIGAESGVAPLDANTELADSYIPGNIVRSATLDTFGDTVAQNLSDAVAELETYADSAVSTHNSDTTSVHGITDTSALATKTYADDAVSTHSSDTTSVHGIADTAALATKTYADTAVSNHSSGTTSVHGIADTAALATKTYADTAVSDHSSDTTSIHGIADTSLLATKSYTDSAAAGAFNDATGNTNDKIGDLTVDGSTGNTIVARIATAKSGAESTAASALSTHNSDTTSVHGIADTSKLVLTDASSQTISGALTITGNLTVEGTTTTVSATNLEVADPLIYIGTGNSGNAVDLGLVGHFNNGTYQHSGLVRDASDSKWKLFSGVVNEPGTTIDFTTWTKDTLVTGPIEATTVTPSSGVVFSDGTQTKEGVPSITPIISKTASYTLSNLTERDSMIEVSSSSGTTITIPADATLDFPIGTSIDICQISTGQVTIAGSGFTPNATPGLKLRTQWSTATLFKRGANSWLVYGDLTA